MAAVRLRAIQGETNIPRARRHVSGGSQAIHL